MRKPLRLVAAAALCLMPAMARAQQQESAPPPATVDPRDVADRRPSLVEPDFTSVNLPTTLRLPRYKSAFRIGHRFAGMLNSPDFGTLAGNLFVDAPRERLPSWRLVEDVRHREAAARARVSVERFQLARYDLGFNISRKFF